MGKDDDTVDAFAYTIQLLNTHKTTRWQRFKSWIMCKITKLTNLNKNGE